MTKIFLPEYEEFYKKLFGLDKRLETSYHQDYADFYEWLESFAVDEQSAAAEPQRETPKHYQKGIHEPIDVIAEWGLNFNLGNVVKYISRAGNKDEVLKELTKALDYLKHEIDIVKNTTTT